MSERADLIAAALTDNKRLRAALQRAHADLDERDEQLQVLRQHCNELEEIIGRQRAATAQRVGVSH